MRVRVRYSNSKGSHNNYYDLKDIQYGYRSVSAYIIRSGGGLSCTMTAKVDSFDRVEMTHSVQHIAGLTEIFFIRKGEIVGGYHKNSRRYRNFGGTVKYDGKDTQINLTCDIRSDRGDDFYKSDYELTIESCAEKIPLKKAA